MLTPKAMAPMYIASTPSSIHFRLFTDWWPMMAMPMISSTTGRKRNSWLQLTRGVAAGAGGWAGGATTADSSSAALLVLTSDLLDHRRPEDALRPEDEDHEEESKHGQQFVSTARR